VDPFEDLGSALTGADILFGNLETPLVEDASRPRVREIRPGFAGAPSSARWLARAGFSLVSLANNHIMDHGVEGLRSTRSALEEAGLLAVGAGESLAEARRPLVLKPRGERIAFLAYAAPGGHSAGARSAGAAPLERSILLEDLRSVREKVSAVVLSLHFGLVYSDYPRPEEQRLARDLLGEGATIILGHHPHVLQGLERHRHGLIAYSLGEILFDPASGHVVNRSAAEIRRDTMVLRVEIDGGSVVGYQVRAARIGASNLHPRALQGDEAQALLRRVESISTPLQGDGLDSLDVVGMATRRTVAHQWEVFRHHLRRGNFRLLFEWIRRLRPRHLLLALRALRSRIGIP
jgi:poly-gamma-glutamate synthesis protein (capsule biosynthesis protein)